MAMTKTKSQSVTPTLSKATTGIRGLDEITQGGLLQGRPTLVCGSTGCRSHYGKSSLIYPTPIAYWSGWTDCRTAESEIVMETQPFRHPTTAFERLLATHRKRSVDTLRLYVAGATARSARTILTLKAACEAHLAGRYDLQIIDIYQQPHLARQEQIVAVLLLVKQEPEPVRRFVGNLSDGARLLAELEIPSEEAV